MIRMNKSLALILLIMVTMTMAVDLRERLSRRYKYESNDEVSTTNVCHSIVTKNAWNYEGWRKFHFFPC